MGPLAGRGADARPERPGGLFCKIYGVKNIILFSLLSVSALPQAARATALGELGGAESLAAAAVPQPAPALAVKSVEELSFPEYCRVNDRNLNALAEEVMTKDSPRDPASGNLFIELLATGPAGKQIRAKVVNVRHAHPGDQFHIEVYAGGALVFKSGRQDNPIFIAFQVDGEPFSLTCFEDIRGGRSPFPVNTDPYIADQASEVIFNWLSADPDANMPALQAWMAANGVQDSVVEFIYHKKHAAKRAEFARTLR